MKIKTRPGEQNAPQIDPIVVKNFFNKRAEKANTVGVLHTMSGLIFFPDQV
jgi:hypothetical protein